MYAHNSTLSSCGMCNSDVVTSDHTSMLAVGGRSRLGLAQSDPPCLDRQWRVTLTRLCDLTCHAAILVLIASKSSDLILHPLCVHDIRTLLPGIPQWDGLDKLLSDVFYKLTKPALVDLCSVKSFVFLVMMMGTPSGHKSQSNVRVSGNKSSGGCRPCAWRTRLGLGLLGPLELSHCRLTTSALWHQWSRLVERCACGWAN